MTSPFRKDFIFMKPAFAKKNSQKFPDLLYTAWCFMWTKANSANQDQTSQNTGQGLRCLLTECSIKISINMKNTSQQPVKFYANLSLSSQVLCRKHYISVYLGEYLPNP